MIIKKNNSFINNINGTNEYETKLMIPWKYEFKWYIIDISYKQIYINSLLEDECYAQLKMKGVENYLNGSLYEDEYLYIYNQIKNSSQIII